MNSDYIHVQLNISPREREIIKSYAKSKGMTFSGYLTQLIRHDLKEISVSESIESSRTIGHAYES